jgi:hypothetical protein
VIIFKLTLIYKLRPLDSNIYIESKSNICTIDMIFRRLPSNSREDGDGRAWSKVVVAMGGRPNGPTGLIPLDSHMPPKSTIFTMDVLSA